LYGFDESTRRQYLPVDSRGFGGALNVRTLSGKQTIARADDGSHDGRLTIQREDGTVVQHGQTPGTIAAVPESTFDRIYAVDYRRRPGIGALIEEAHTSGLDLLGRGVDLEGLSDLEQQLRQQRDSLATIPRVQATHDDLCSRRVVLLRAISDLETALGDQPDEEVLTGQIKRLEAQLNEWKTELRTLQTELKAVEHRRQHILAGRDAEPRTRYVNAPQIAELDALVDQIERWQNTLREITSRRQLFEERADQYGSRELLSDPRRCLGEIEAQLDEVQSTLAEIDDSANYLGREIRPLFTEVFADLRANVYRLCNQLSYWETMARHKDCANEAKDLIRCEAELRLAIKGATARKESLQTEIEATFGQDAIALTAWNDAHCECAEHPPLRTEKLVTEVQSDWEHELSIVSAEIASFERRQDRLVADIDDIESDLTDVRAQVKRLDRVELLDQLDAKRAELRRLEQNLRDSDRRRELLAEIASTEEAITELKAHSQTSTLVTNASEYLRRLTAGDLRKIEVAANEQVWVVDEYGRRRAYHQLRDGGRDLVYLSICLALVEGFKARGIQVPMIVSGAFTHVDSKNMPEAAELLRDVAAQGHQIFLFTRHEHVASVFRLLNVPIRTLERISLPPARLTTGELPPTDEGPTGDIAVDATDDDNYDEDETFTLSEHSLIEDAPAIDATNVARLRKIGVMRVGDLLRLSAKSAASELQEYGITADQIVSWKAQTRLLCEVPRLRGYDARILVACGITEPEQLYRLSPSELRAIVKDMAASSNGQTLLLSGTEFELSRVADWIGTRSARSHANRSGSSNRGDRSSNRGHRSSRDRSHYRRERSERHRRDRDPNVVKMRSGNSQWKFYLGRNDSVVEAPSIGARTAERLGAIGIKTVSDLLNADPDSVSGRLEVKRFTAKVVTEWQQQTELACRVPQLRGHDAQILVALGITDVEELAASDPQELWTHVEPFVETKEGKRIIRNGKTPDLEEVAEWVQWAQAARQLNAA
jgi:septal ring factor EnvC (AmiA/AmiB activator)